MLDQHVKIGCCRILGWIILRPWLEILVFWVLCWRAKRWVNWINSVLPWLMLFVVKLGFRALWTGRFSRCWMGDSMWLRL